MTSLAANIAGAAANTAMQDDYPSRINREARVLDRLDPVVYASTQERAPLSPQQLKQYERDGFVVLDNLFQPDEVQLLKQELELLRETPDSACDTRINEPADNTLRSIFAIHRSNVLFERLASDSRLVDVARYVLDDEVYIHQSRLNYKPGFRGKEFFWHSDFETWHVEDGMPRMRALSMSVTLTENNASNGALMLIPRSHRHFISCEGVTPENHFHQSLRKQELGVPTDSQVDQLVTEGGIFTAEASPGSVILFDCNTVHGSNGNITPWPRSNAFYVYNAISNRVVEPFCARASRPDYVCTRQAIEPVSSRRGHLSRA